MKKKVEGLHFAMEETVEKVRAEKVEKEFKKKSKKVIQEILESDNRQEVLKKVSYWLPWERESQPEEMLQIKNWLLRDWNDNENVEYCFERAEEITGFPAYWIIEQVQKNKAA